MKVLILALFVLLIAGASARSYNTYTRTNHFNGAEGIKIEQEDTLQASDNQTLVDFYFGLILGWQTQQSLPGQCHADNKAFFKSLNDTLHTFMKAFLPSVWFNFLDRIRINIDTLSKGLQSCQVHSILTKLQRMVTMDGIIETAARLMTQIAFLQGYVTKFITFFNNGELQNAGIQVGLLSSAIIGVTVN